MTDTARDHLERAVAWLTDLESENGAHRPGALRGKLEPYLESDATRMGAARAEVWHALELLDAIPPREATEEMLRAGMRELNHNWLRSPPSDLWRAMYDAALAEKGKE